MFGCSASDQPACRILLTRVVVVVVVEALADYRKRATVAVVAVKLIVQVLLYRSTLMMMMMEIGVARQLSFWSTYHWRHLLPMLLQMIEQTRTIDHRTMTI